MRDVTGQQALMVLADSAMMLSDRYVHGMSRSGVTTRKREHWP